MDAESRCYLSYADVRSTSSPGQKAMLLLSKYGMSKKAAARLLNFDPATVRRAIAATEEGREIGRIGRPETLDAKDRAELQSVVKKMVQEHRSPTRQHTPLRFVDFYDRA